MLRKTTLKQDFHEHDEAKGNFHLGAVFIVFVSPSLGVRQLLGTRR
jgi:hypothetical protein